MAASRIHRRHSGRTGLVEAAVLAGGLGTRLRSAVGDCPKVLAPVGDRPYLTYVLDQLADAGARRVVLLTGYQADRVYRALGEAYRGMTLAHAPEPSPLGTGGSLRRALPQLASPAVLVVNGDSYCDVDLAALCTFHRWASADLSLVVTEVADTSRYGTVDVTADGRVTRFREKATAAGPGWINAGLYLFNRALIEEIPPDGPISLERDLLPAWLSRGRSVHGFRCRGRFLDIGTPASYAAAEAFFGKQETAAVQWITT